MIPAAKAVAGRVWKASGPGCGSGGWVEVAQGSESLVAQGERRRVAARPEAAVRAVARIAVGRRPRERIPSRSRDGRAWVSLRCQRRRAWRGTGRRGAARVHGSRPVGPDGRALCEGRRGDARGAVAAVTLGVEATSTWGLSFDEPVQRVAASGLSAATAAASGRSESRPR